MRRKSWSHSLLTLVGSAVGSARFLQTRTTKNCSSAFNRSFVGVCTALALLLVPSCLLAADKLLIHGHIPQHKSVWRT